MHTCSAFCAFLVGDFQHYFFAIWCIYIPCLRTAQQLIWWRVLTGITAVGVSFQSVLSTAGPLPGFRSRVGDTFLMQYWMYAATEGPNMNGGTDFKWGGELHWPPHWWTLKAVVRHCSTLNRLTVSYVAQASLWCALVRLLRVWI